MKKWACLMMGLLLLTASANAEIYTGSTVSNATSWITAEAGGTLEWLQLTVGQWVEADEIVGTTSVTKVFATQDGTVSMVDAEVGDEVSGTVLELAPVSRYTVYCTTSKAYDAAENQVVHSGESLYVKCTKNGTHRGIGRVTEISGDTFTLEMTAGELYVGETVYLFREDTMLYESRVGIGTVVSPDPEDYDVNGVLLSLRVQQGDTVERGQLLMTYASDAQTSLVAPVSGIVTSLNCKQGETVQAGAKVAEVTAPEDILLKLVLPEEDAADLHVGRSVTYIRATDPEETIRYGQITAISHIAGEDGIEVLIQPEETESLIGMTVEVTIE